MLFAALVLMAIWRPVAARPQPARPVLVAVFGLRARGMNLSFYSALDRIPLGAAVTFEFVGPLGVAVSGSRRPLDLVWVALAAAGILLLSDLGHGGLDALGIALALLAGAFWAAYILLGARVGQRFEGADGLALAMVVGRAVLVPVGVADGGGELLVPWILAAGAAVAVLSSAIPYALEMEALRRLPDGGLRRADVARARNGRARRLRAARRGPGGARDRRDPAGRRRQRGRFPRRGRSRPRDA